MTKPTQTGSNILSKQLNVLMNAHTLNSNIFITEPTDLHVMEASNKNNLLDHNDYQDNFVNIEET